MLDYYLTHSKYSNPGNFKYFYDEYPRDISIICSHLHGLFLHYADANIFDVTIDHERYSEMNQRFLDKKLQEIINRDNRSLLIERNPEERILGICRDTALLLCSILREQGVAARLRSGFVNYVIPGLFLDGFTVEYFDTDDNRWKLADSRTSLLLIQHHQLRIDFDLADVPNTKFISAAAAWNLCRNGLENPSRFGSRQYRGLFMVRNRLIQDLALLNKHELLVWDLWGLMLQPLDTEFELLDELSDLLLNNSYDLEQVNSFYNAHKILQVPDHILVDSPFLPETWVSLRGGDC